jgi:hypothetical protein
MALYIVELFGWFADVLPVFADVIGDIVCFTK